VVRQPALPLWRRVVFVDWHDVLSRSPYWASVVTEARHPLHRPLRVALGRLYGNPELMAGWTTGRLRTEDVVAALGVEPVGRYDADWLCRRVEADCRLMRVNVELLRVLQVVRERAFVVVATDNVPPFARTFRHAAGARRLVPAPVDDTLASWAPLCDDLICSSDVGIRKEADPVAFFGPYLAACGLRFEDALLIDDRSANCSAFRAAGGSALRWTMHTDPLELLTTAVENWLPLAPSEPPEPEPAEVEPHPAEPHPVG